MTKRLLAFITIMLALSSCAKAPVTRPELALEQVGWWRAGLSADDLDFRGLGDAARQSMEYYMKLPPETAASPSAPAA